jgi:hypothetical protein
MVQLERKKEAERVGAIPEEDPRTLPDDRGNYAIMHAIARGNNSMAALLDACALFHDFFASQSLLKKHRSKAMFPRLRRKPSRSVDESYPTAPFACLLTEREHTVSFKDCGLIYSVHFTVVKHL